MDSENLGKALLAGLLMISVYQEYNGVPKAAPAPKVVEITHAPKVVAPEPTPMPPPKPTIDKENVFREVLTEAKHHADDFVSKDGAKNILKLLENLYNKKISN